MVSAFKKNVLNYLSQVHCVPSYQGPADLLKVKKIALPQNRTIYRWHKSLKSVMEFYPSIDLSSFGLVHVHIILSGACDEMLRLPFALEAYWLMPKPGERVLYLHCALPEDFKKDFQLLFKDLKKAGFFKGFVHFFSFDGWQVVHELSNCIDGDGRIRFPIVEEFAINKEAFGKKLMSASGLMKSYPLVVPVIFENFGKRLSLIQSWGLIRQRVGRRVWSYLPKGTRKMPVNGKGYVKRAFKLLCDWSLFRQNIIHYRPLLDHSVEIFMILITNKNDDIYYFIEGFREICPVVEFYPGTQNVSMLRILGDTDLIYALMDRFPEGTQKQVEIFFLDKSKTWGMEKCRLLYEQLFDPKKGVWCFDKETIFLQMLEVNNRGSK